MDFLDSSFLGTAPAVSGQQLINLDESQKLEFKEEVINAVIKGMSSLGKSGSTAILYHLNVRYGASVDEILEKPDEFISGLRNIFKDASVIVEQSILEELRSRFVVPTNFTSLSSVLRRAALNWKASDSK